ncbi:hypothetical protein KO566_08070 [Flavobacteriaceae bacterium XHP0103]|nr:hypothetical protein [Marixanthotalea marina]MBU3822012.1 hypothetical protein [Marixanthotalea marina]
MKALKFTLLVAVLFATLSSCTKQDLNEDDLLLDTKVKVELGGDGDTGER